MGLLVLLSLGDCEMMTSSCLNKAILSFRVIDFQMIRFGKFFCILCMSYFKVSLFFFPFLFMMSTASLHV